MIVLLLSILSLAPDEPKPPIPARESSQHVGERCTVEMHVRATKDETSRKLYYLDSEADFRDPVNLAVVIDYENLPAFRKAGIPDPIAHYKGKKIHVTGKITRNKSNSDGLEIQVREPGEIRIVKDK